MRRPAAAAAVEQEQEQEQEQRRRRRRRRGGWVREEWVEKGWEGEEVRAWASICISRSPRS